MTASFPWCDLPHKIRVKIVTFLIAGLVSRVIRDFSLQSRHPSYSDQHKRLRMKWQVKQIHYRDVIFRLQLGLPDMRLDIRRVLNEQMLSSIANVQQHTWKLVCVKDKRAPVWWPEYVQPDWKSFDAAEEGSSKGSALSAAFDRSHAA
jgi:hypothetical protein